MKGKVYIFSSVPYKLFIPNSLFPQTDWGNAYYIFSFFFVLFLFLFFLFYLFHHVNLSDKFLICIKNGLYSVFFYGCICRYYCSYHTYVVFSNVFDIL